MADPIKRFFAANQRKLIQLTQTLVRVPSVNGNETEVAKILVHFLDQNGIKSKLLGKDKRRQSLIAEFGRGSRSLLLNGHLDTVPPGDLQKWRLSPFDGKIVGNKLFGRGTQDMKAGVAAAAFAAVALKQTGTKLPGTLKLVFNSDEESGQHTGIKEVIRSGISADAAIVGEPMFNQSIQIGARGIYRFSLTAFGKSGHTAQQSGINAVTKMAKLLLALEEIQPRFKQHPLFAPPKITAGTVISAGTVINIFPDSCVALVDCRLSYGQTKASLLNDIKKVFAELRLADSNLRYEIKELAYVPPTLIDAKSDIVKVSRTAIKKIMNFTPTLKTMTGVSDGALLIEAGIPSVIFGPEGKNLHSENEWVSIRSLIKTSEVYTEIVRNYFGII